MCVRPIVINDNVVPCGKCFDCKRQDRMNWTIRVQDEIKEGLFVTLTYDNEHLKEFVDKKDIQDYIKRIRETLRRQKYNGKVKYFAVGEYGDRFGRSHYHIIINITDSILITRLWNKGIVHVGRVTNRSIHYCTKYVQKNLGKRKEKKGREFRLMSKGLGKNYIEKYGKHHKDNLILSRCVNYKTYSLPRYYKDKIFDKQDIEYRQERDKQIEKKLKKLIDKYEGLLGKEVDTLKIEKFNKQLERFKSLLILNSINLKK